MLGVFVVVVVFVLQVGDSLFVLLLFDFEGWFLDLCQYVVGCLLLINVWVSWCVFCVEEMFELVCFVVIQGDNGVQVLGLVLDIVDGVCGFLQWILVDYLIVVEMLGLCDVSVQLGNMQGLLFYSVLFDVQGWLVKVKLGLFVYGEIDGWVK